MFWGKLLLDSYCHQQHTISLSSAEAELHEIVNGVARGLFIRNVLQAMELKAVVRVGKRLERSRGNHSVAWCRASATSGKSRSCGYKNRLVHELKVSRVKSEDNRADLLTKFFDPDRHYKLIKLLVVSVAGTGREMAKSAALGVVCSLLPVRATASNQIEAVEESEEMSVAAGRLARGSETQVVEFFGGDKVDTLVGKLDAVG